MEKKVTRVSCGISDSTAQPLVKGMSVVQATQGVQKSPQLIGNPEEEAENNRVLLHIETNYGTAEEWVTLKSEPANPPTITGEAKEEFEAELNQYKTGDSIDISLASYGRNLSATADYAIRDVSYTIAGGNFPSSLSLDYRTGRITGTAQTGSYSFTIAVATNQGTLHVPVSFTTRSPVPSTISGWNTAYWEWADGLTSSSHLSLKAKINNTDQKWTPPTSTSKVVNYAAVKFLCYTNFDVVFAKRYSWGTGTPHYWPFPGRLGEVLGQDILLQPSGSYAFVLVYQSAQGRLRVWRSPVLDWLCQPDYHWGSTISGRASDTAHFFTYYGVYNQLALDLNQMPRSTYGYDSKNKKIARYRRYRNHCWIGLPPEHGQDWVIFPVECLVPEYGKSAGRSITSAPDYDWGNGSPCPNATGGEIFL